MKILENFFIVIEAKGGPELAPKVVKSNLHTLIARKNSQKRPKISE